MTKLLVLMNLLVLLIQLVNAQSRCDTACSNSPTCSQGLCYLSKCSDVGTCYSYCFNCNGNIKCYATGASCAYSSLALLYSTGSKLITQFSYVLIISLLSLKIFF